MTGYKQKYYQIIEKLKNLLITYYGERIVCIVLFGSVGRDKFHSGSDIDILIILDDVPRGRSKRFFEYYNNVYLNIEKDIHDLMGQGINIMLSLIIKSKEEVQYGSPLFIEMAEECKILYDKDDFFSGVLQALRKKLQKYKSKKVYFKGKYYWKLKPDYRWGDEIEL